MRKRTQYSEFRSGSGSDRSDRPRGRNNGDSNRTRRGPGKQSDSDGKPSYKSDNERPRRTSDSPKSGNRFRSSENPGNERPRRTSDSPKTESRFSSNSKPDTDFRAPRRSSGRPSGDRSKPSGGFREKSFGENKRTTGSRNAKPSFTTESKTERKPYKTSGNTRKPNTESGDKEQSSYGAKRNYKPTYGRKPASESKSLKNLGKANRNFDSETIRLNKYISNSGICSRREADVFISNGVVTVNGKVVTELGYKVNVNDKVQFDGRSIRPEPNRYLLLNKPKDYITTAEDPDGRRTVMALIQGACKERLYPVGRLDRNTTGLLLFTNDGELADKLMHPRKMVKKIYKAELDKNLQQEHFDAIVSGIQLEDGFFKVDTLEYAEDAGTKKILGVEIHSGRNRIVRRIFEHFGYNVVKLDRVLYAGLTKKDLARGKWRFLSEQEIRMLKML